MLSGVYYVRVPKSAGTIRFQVVTNDGKPEHMIWLIGIKNIYSQQLPNMPKEYIVRLVLDRQQRAPSVSTLTASWLANIILNPSSVLTSSGITNPW